MSNQQPKVLSRADLMAIISHLQSVIGMANGVSGNDRNPGRAAQTAALLRYGHNLCVSVRSTEKPSFGSRSPYAKMALPDVSNLS
jgi:hypothetical protein